MTLNGKQFGTYYHRTDPDLAENILREGRFQTAPHIRQGHVFFSDRADAEGASGFGSAVVEVRAPRSKMEPDGPPFETGEQHWHTAPENVEVTRAWVDLDDKWSARARVWRRVHGGDK
jgi:hypothetical protein